MCPSSMAGRVTPAGHCGFSHVIDEVAGKHERVTVTRHGSPVAVMAEIATFPK